MNTSEIASMLGRLKKGKKERPSHRKTASNLRNLIKANAARAAKYGKTKKSKRAQTTPKGNKQP